MTGSCSTLKDFLTKGKDIPQNAKRPLWLSSLSMLSICRPTCSYLAKTNQTQLWNFKKSLLFPHMTVGTCPAQLGRFIWDFLSVLYCLWNRHYLYRCYFLEQELLAFAGSFLKLFKWRPLFLHLLWPQAPPNIEQLIEKSDFSISNMHCRFYIHFSVTFICVRVCVRDICECCRECFKRWGGML